MNSQTESIRSQVAIDTQEIQAVDTSALNEVDRQGPNVINGFYKDQIFISSQNQLVVSVTYNNLEPEYRSLFKLRIIGIYIIHYALQIKFQPEFDSQQKVLNHDSIFSQILLLSSFLVLINMPFLIYNLKLFQKAIDILLYYVAYGFFIHYLCMYDGVINGLVLFYNYLALVQLIILGVMLCMCTSEMRFSYYYVVTIITQCIIMLFDVLPIGYNLIIITLRLLYAYWFSFALKKVTSLNFGLNQNQGVLGSMAVYIVMMCPWVEGI